MESLDEYNKRRRAEHDATRRAMNRGNPNGIACPTCGSELFDSTPYETMMSDPPQKRVHCNECRYSGLRVV